jgi:hypothetical protein
MLPIVRAILTSSRLGLSTGLLLAPACPQLGVEVAQSAASCRRGTRAETCARLRDGLLA